MAPLVAKFPGIDKELQKVLEANMDEAPARQHARDSFKDIQLGIDHILFKVLLYGVCVCVCVVLLLWFIAFTFI